MLLSCVLTGSALLAFAHARSLPWLLAASVPLGLGAGAVDAALNGYVARHYSGRHMNWLHACWGLGAMCGPLLMGRALSTELGWEGGYRLLGAAQLSLAALFLFTLHFWSRVPERVADATDHATADVPTLPANSLAGWLSPGLFALYVALETATGLWAATVLTLGRGFTAGHAAWCAAGYYGAIMSGRILVGAVVERWGNRLLISLGILLALAGACAFAAAKTPLVTALALGFTGLGFAPVYPCLMHEVPRRFRTDAAQTVIGRQSGAAYLGMAVLPASLGWVAEHSLASIPWIVCGGIVLLLAGVRRLDRMHNGRVVATTPVYMEVNKLELAAGRFLIKEDGDLFRNVAILGAATADKLFPFDDPIGQSVVLSNHEFQVVGILKDRMPTGGAGGSQAAEDYNSDVYIPLTTSRRRFGDVIVQRSTGSRGAEKVELSQVTMTIDANVDNPEERKKVKAAGDLIKDMLERSHAKNDWAVTIPLDQLEQAEQTEANFERLLALIASISLFVGGIGIMNIMLATVTERTREIGIRRALGAKRRDIVYQFLIEAVVQTSIGGLLGIAGGIAVVYAVPAVAEWWTPGTKIPAVLQIQPMVYSFFVAAAIGVLFGLYPAWRAAQLDPIEALRHE